MNIKCPACGHENQLGAIFCRNCGGKLDLEALRPEIQDHKIAGGSMAGIIQRLMIALVFLVIIAMVATSLLPFGLTPYSAPSEETLQQAQTKFHTMQIKIDAEAPSKHVFTPQEATAAFNSEVLGKEKPTEANYTIEHVMFDISASGEVTIDADIRLFGKVPARISLSGRPKVADGVASFEVSSAKIGHFPMPSDFLKAALAEKLGSLAGLPAPKKLIAAIQGFEINSDGNFAISLPGTKKTPAPAAKK